MEGDILQRELGYQREVATRALKVLDPVPDYIVDRYAECKGWRYFPKEAIFRTVRDYVAGKKGLLACDFGCGSGANTCQLALVLPELQVIGLDVSPDLIDVARCNAEVNGISERVKFMVGDAEKDLLEQESVDIMLALDVMHHVEIEMALPNILRAVRPGGMVIFIEPVAFSSVLQKIRDITPVEKDVSPDERQLNKQEVKLLVNSLKNVQIRYFRMLGRLARFLPNRNRIDKGHSVTKFTLYFLYGIDQILFRCFPVLQRFASQVLIVGHK